MLRRIMGQILSLTLRLLVRYQRRLRWLLRRLTPNRYLGLHLILGLLTAVGCLWLFGKIAEDFVTQDPLVRFDQMVANTLHYLATPTLTTFFLVFTVAGSVEALASLGLVVLSKLLKPLFARSRPSFADPLLVESSYSFPSTHAILSLIAYGVLAYFIVLALRTWRAKT